jgi:MFS family permease
VYPFTRKRLESRLNAQRPLERNIRIYYFFNTVLAAAFVVGNWIFVWLRVMSNQQVGIVDAIAFAFGLVMEVPTGAVADLLGKRGTMIAAMFLAGAGWIIMGTGDTLTQLLLGFLVSQTGWAFYSGAAEALVYDSLVEMDQVGRFEQVISRGHSLHLVANVAATLIGGVMYLIHFRLPHLAWGGLHMFGFLAAFWLIEPKVAHIPFSWAAYRNQLAQGFRQLWQPALRYYIPLFFATTGVGFIITIGLVQYVMAIAYGYGANEQAILFAITGLAASGAVLFVPRIRRRFSDFHSLLLVAALLLIALLVSAFPLGLLAGGAVLLFLRVVISLSQPIASILVNSAIPSEYRATTISTMALITKIPYIFTAVIAGVLAERGQIGVFNLWMAGGIFVLTLISMVWSSYFRPRSSIALES